MPPDPMEIVAPILKGLADEQRIKILAHVLDGRRTAAEIEMATNGLDRRVINHQLAFLCHVGLLEETGGVYRFRREAMHEALRAASQRQRGPEDEEDREAFDLKVLQTFLVDGRLVSIPSQQKKRDAVLRYLASRFEPDRMYDEREVNALLRAYHDDVASLRRYLVDGGFLQRQIIRSASMKELVAGEPEIDLRVSYWKPG